MITLEAGEGVHLPGAPANCKLRNLQVTKNGAETRTKGKDRWRGQQSQARMAVGARRRGRRIAFGRRIGRPRKDVASGVKISGNYKSLGWQRGQPPQNVSESDGAQRQGLVVESRERKRLGDTCTFSREGFEQVNCDLSDVDKKFDTEFEEMREGGTNVR